MTKDKPSFDFSPLKPEFDFSELEKRVMATEPVKKDIYQEYADEHGISRAEAKLRIWRSQYL